MEPPYVHQIRERGRRKTAATTKEGVEQAYSLSPQMDPSTYCTTFNNYVSTMRETEYRTRYPGLFSWNQTHHFMNKLTTPEPLLRTSPSIQLSPKNRLETPKDGLKNSALLNTKRKSDGQTSRKLSRITTKDKMDKLQRDSRLLTEPGSFRPHKPNKEFDFEALRSFYSSTVLKSPKPYQSTRIQTSLLDKRRDIQTSEIPNLQYMLNPFDRKNLPVNKALSLMPESNNLLDKEKVKRETLNKIEFVSGGIKLRPQLRPKTNIEVIRSPRKLKRPNTDTASKGSEITNKLRFIITTNETPLNLNNDKWFDNNYTKPNSPNGGDETAKLNKVKKKENSVYFIRSPKDLEDLNLTHKKKNGRPHTKGWEDRNLASNIGMGLSELQEIYSLRMRTEDEDSGYMTPGLSPGVKTPKQDLRRYAQTEDDEKINALAENVGDDNIFAFKNYFKKRYLETGISMEVSPSLRSKIKGINKNVSSAIKDIEVRSFR